MLCPQTTAKLIAGAEWRLPIFEERLQRFEVGNYEHVYSLDVTKRQKETAEKVPSVFEKWEFRGIFELKSVLISPQERGKLGKENTFSALSEGKVHLYQ